MSSKRLNLFAGSGQPLGNWLSGMDSNHDKGLQRALCYHYTTGQSERKLAVHMPLAKEILGFLQVTH